jgi:serine/threonine-protein kinase RsbW
MEQFTLSIPSCDEEARTLIARAMLFFSEKKKEGLARSVDDYIFRLALDETVTNAVVHGNGKNPRKRVTVSISVFEAGLKLRVSDEGAGFNPLAVGDPRTERLRWRRGGRGVHLMRSFGTVKWDTGSRCVTVEL